MGGDYCEEYCWSEEGNAAGCFCSDFFMIFFEGAKVEEATVFEKAAYSLPLPLLGTTLRFAHRLQLVLGRLLAIVLLRYRLESVESVRRPGSKRCPP